jgi:hypothetical protein
MVFRFFKSTIPVFLLLVFSFPTIFALMQNGFFISDDGEWMIIRLSAFYEIFRTGEIPVRFIARLNNGYGYPLGDFMYPGFLYIGSLIHLLGFGFINSIKLIFGLSMLFSGVFTYFWIQKIFSKTAGFFAALVYVYTPYHLFDMYSRGSIGEILALCMIPFIFWQIERKDTMFISLGIGCLILSHNSLAFLFLIPLYLYYVLGTDIKGIQKCLYASIPFMLGLLVSLFFWLPALYDLQFTIFKAVVISEWQNYFANLQLIGGGTIVILIVSLGVLFYRRKKISYRSQAYFFIILCLIGMFLASEYSSSIWHVFSASIIQFPFRALSFLLPSLAFLLAFSLSAFSLKKQLIFGIIITAFVIGSSYVYIYPKAFTDKDDMYYISNFSTTTVKDEYMPVWVKEALPPTPTKKIVLSKGEGSISSENIYGNDISFAVHMRTLGVVQIHTIYFPGWKAWIGDKAVDIQYENKYGLMQIPLEIGNHTVSLHFTETPIRIFANIVSLITLILVILFFIKVRYNAREKLS